jgi:hypothetical protein
VAKTTPSGSWGWFWPPLWALGHPQFFLFLKNKLLNTWRDFIGPRVFPLSQLMEDQFGPLSKSQGLHVIKIKLEGERNKKVKP